LFWKNNISLWCVGDFHSRLPKGVRQFKGFDEKVISLYARGMTTREIQGHLEEIYTGLSNIYTTPA